MLQPQDDASPSPFSSCGFSGRLAAAVEAPLLEAAPAADDELDGVAATPDLLGTGKGPLARLDGAASPDACGDSPVAVEAPALRLPVSRAATAARLRSLRGPRLCITKARQRLSE